MVHVPVPLVMVMLVEHVPEAVKVTLRPELAVAVGESVVPYEAEPGTLIAPMLWSALRAVTVRVTVVAAA